MSVFPVKGVETMVNIVKSDMMSAVCIVPEPYMISLACSISMPAPLSVMAILKVSGSLQMEISIMGAIGK